MLNPRLTDHALRPCLLAAAIALAADAAATPTPLGCVNTAIVSTANDSGAGSLRNAVSSVCAKGTIEFAQRFVIQLASEIVIDQALTIDGSRVASASAGTGNALVQLRGGADHRIFRITQTGNLSLVRLRLSNGNVPGTGGAASNSGELRVFECRMDNNSAASGNLGGGAIFSDVGSTLRIEGSTFDGNSATRGAAVFNVGEAELLNSSFSGNRGITNEGAIQNRGILVANHITVTDNGRIDSTPTAGGLFAFNADTTIINSILAGNRGPDCFISGGVVDTVATLAQDTRSCTAQLTSAPELQPLAGNGGVTRTHGLSATSPALGAGDRDFCLPRDQRGFVRPDDDRCDLGALERGGFDPDQIFNSGFESQSPPPAVD
ncbi:choice-of-anchor Q domain-containing protein [Aquimonas voraii]|uniref:Polymorphic outer membrane protein repeat-containing protein n=1 Tax=Aquimonas voraii TaxID=265719 RepID=A0A1G6UEX5_9GAMM|nr:choice-of-anchor Q domain-containing protein [Aquimonas voraii]SDD39147.1 hypothetical protein SAMN04488509_102277 [Aquimonas voraii]